MSNENPNGKVEMGKKYSTFEKTIKTLEVSEKSNVNEQKAKIHEDCESAISEHGEETKKKAEKVKKKADEDIAKIEKPGTEPDKKKTKEHQEWENKKKLYDEKVKALKDQSRLDQETLWQEHYAVKARLYAMSTTAQKQIDAAYAARDNATNKVSEQVARSLNEGIDSTDQDTEEWRHRAEFAQSVADDGTLYSLVADEVGDYLSCKIENPNKPKEPEKISDGDLERITQGIVAVLHDPNAAEKDDAAVGFVKRLAGREDREDLFSLRGKGVDAKDVRDEVLRNLGYNVDDRNVQKYGLPNAPAYTLFNDIVTDKSIPPHLKGMLLGKLKSDEKNRDQVVARVAKMREMLKRANNEGAEVSTDISKYAVFAGLINAPLAMTFEGYRDEFSLERAGAIFLMLNDMVDLGEFEAAKASYEGFVEITGKNDEKLQAMIDDPSKSPQEKAAAIMAALPVLEKAYKEEKVKDIKAENTYKEGEELYAFYFGDKSVFTDFGTALDGLKGKSLLEFQAGIAELKQRIDKAAEHPSMVAIANKTLGAMQQQIAEAKEYEAARKKAATAGVDINGYEALDTTAFETALNGGQDATAIMNAIKDNEAIVTKTKDAKKKTEELNQKIEEAKAAKAAAARRSSGGGGRRRNSETGGETGSGVVVIPSALEVFQKRFDISNHGTVTPPPWVENEASVKKYDGQSEVIYYEVRKSDSERYGVAVDKDGKKVYYEKR